MGTAGVVTDKWLCTPTRLYAGRAPDTTLGRLRPGELFVFDVWIRTRRATYPTCEVGVKADGAREWRNAHQPDVIRRTRAGRALAVHHVNPDHCFSVGDPVCPVRNDGWPELTKACATIIARAAAQ